MATVNECCDQLIDCCQRGDRHAALAALTAFNACVDERPAVAGTATHQPDVLDACQQKLQQARTQAAQPKAQASVAGISIPPAFWIMLIDVGVQILDMIRQSVQHQPAPAPAK